MYIYKYLDKRDNDDEIPLWTPTVLVGYSGHRRI